MGVLVALRRLAGIVLPFSSPGLSKDGG